MSIQHRSKRRRLEDVNAGQRAVSSTAQSADEDNVHAATPRKSINVVDNPVPISPSGSPAALDTAHLAPLDRTLGMFKKYHRQTPSSTPQASPSSARKYPLITSTASPSKTTQASPLSARKYPRITSTRSPSSAPQASLSARKHLHISSTISPSKQSHAARISEKSKATSERESLFARQSSPRSRSTIRSPMNTAQKTSRSRPEVVGASSKAKRTHASVREETSTDVKQRDDSAVALGSDDEDMRGLAAAASVQKLDKNTAKAERDEQSDGDEIVVRSSGRKRTVSEKLRAVRDEQVKAERSPAPKHRKTRPSEGPVESVSSRERTRAKPNAILGTHLKKHALGKENVVPIEGAGHDTSPVNLLQTTSEVSHKPSEHVVEEESITLATEYSTQFSTSQLVQVRTTVLARLTGQQPIPIHDLAEQYSRTSSLIEQTIAAGESNSMLVIGSRGTGKSAMVNQILHEQREKHTDDFHVVRLNGFIHTDDKLALREIWRQLGREMDIDNSIHSYADTMSMLLALLSHPLELEQTVEAGRLTKSVICILDEFDLFATHPRQTLLYNLLDIAQSRKAPIAVLGLTTRVDAVEQLEKRVRSRFSHRYVHLSPAKSLAAYEHVCKSTLTLVHTEGLESWNKVIDVLFSSPSFKSHLSKLYHRTKSVPEFMSTMLIPIATLATRSATSSSILEHILSQLSTTALSTTKLDGLSSLPTIAVAMLVCAARQSIYSIENVTFDGVYEEYKMIASKMKLQATASGALASSRVWAKEIAKVAWLDLVEHGYIIDGRIDISLTELADCGDDLGQWSKWCREI